MSGFNIGGLASGLDTNAILTQLLQIERIPIQQLQSRQTKLDKTDETWGQVVTRLSSARTAINNLSTGTKWGSFVTATSSNTNVLKVSTTGNATPGAVNLTVQKLAYARQRATDAAEGFTASDTAMGTRGKLTITHDGTAYEFTPLSADETVSQFAARINETANVPVRAQVVKRADNDYRLVLTSKDTGLANDFTVATAGWSGAFDSLQIAQDAEILVGDSSSTFVATRSSNVITDLIDGLRIELVSESASAVTVTTDRDVNKAAAAVGSLVSALNSVATYIRSASAYDAEKKVAQPLTGDSLAREIVSNLLTAVVDSVPGTAGDYTLASAVGIELTQDGAVTLDETKLRDALSTDWDAVVGLFTRTATTSDARVTYLSSTDSTQPGDHTVVVTQAAQIAEKTGTAYTALAQEMHILHGGVDIQIDVVGDETLADMVLKINTRLDEEGIADIRAEESGGAIRLFSEAYGSSVSFQVVSTEDAFGLVGTHTGKDVVAEIAGVEFTGTGQAVTASSGDADGLSLQITATQAEVDAAAGALDLGTVTARQGLAGQIGEVVARLEGADGEIQRVRDRLADQREIFQERIDRLELVILQRETHLRRQFTALEVAMNNLIQQGNRVAQALSGLQAQNGNK